VLIFRYLVKETLKSQAAVFLVLMAIFITNKFVRVLSEASNGDIPASLVLGFLALSMPVLASLILPLSLFLGIMLAHGRLYVDSEMTVMRSCGISEWYVTRVMLVVAVAMAVLTGAMTLWMAPLAVEMEYQLEEQAGAGLITIIPGRFQQTANKKAVIFVHQIGDDKEPLKRVFLAQHDTTNDDQNIHLVYAQQGGLREGNNGAETLVLSNGVQYEGISGQQNYRVVEFGEYQLQIAEQQAEQKRRKLSAYPTMRLLDDPSIDAMAELQWRLSIPVSLFFLVIIAVPLSAADPRQGRFGKMFPALMLYLGYFLLLLAARKVMEDGKVPAQLGLWWVHGVVALIGITLLFRGRPLGVRLRARLRGQG
jgi:lipopolysaccharide export system permease protein